jgi:RNA polymerase sigma-70 factor (ECF subfamily)
MSEVETERDRISPEALERLLAGRRQFLAFVEKRVGSRAEAEDILQEAFVRGIERGGALRDDESVVAWFYRLLRNAVIDHYRRRATSEKALEGWAKELETHSIPAIEIKQEVCGCLGELVAALKPEYQQALRVIDLGEGSLKDLAKEAGIAPGNAAVRVHRAREALRKEIQRACGVCAEHGCLDCHCSSLSDCR